MGTGTFFIGSDIYRTSSYGRQHPLAIPRVSTVIDLLRALGWLAEGAYLESPKAGVDELARFHDRDYIAALQRAEAGIGITPEESRRFNIGCNGNPIFREIFSRPATACGGSLLAASMLLAGTAGAVYNPAGGTHHGRADRASGFCYLNEPVLTIFRLLDSGIRRVLYLDFDAHHCDGVADVFADDPRVIMLSIHEAGRWPNTGAVGEQGCGNLFNLPVPPAFHDDEMALLREEVVVPLAASVAPEIVLVQCGADALAEDPLSRLALSNGALWKALAAIRQAAPRLLVLGGGGYNPWSVARCWAGVWALLDDRPIPERLPADAQAVLRALTWSRSAGRNPPEHWFTTLADQPRGGPIRADIRNLAQLHRARLRALPDRLDEAV
ncbi:MAG: acetoin utilization protein AcuC [Alphaproteobacteria bacterium]|nr:acetoin utilization protein AcuC [Alphaproteobacteria bacterium]